MKLCIQNSEFSPAKCRPARGPRCARACGQLGAGLALPASLLLLRLSGGTLVTLWTMLRKRRSRRQLTPDTQGVAAVRGSLETEALWLARPAVGKVRDAAAVKDGAHSRNQARQFWRLATHLQQRWHEHQDAAYRLSQNVGLKQAASKHMARAQSQRNSSVPHLELYSLCRLE